MSNSNGKLLKGKNKTSKSKAIKDNCLECSGDSPKEVTLCYIVDCSLWPFRFGYSSNDRRYSRRMEVAKRNYPEEFKEMQRLLSEYS